jgi:hypothetical protein
VLIRGYFSLFLRGGCGRLACPRGELPRNSKRRVRRRRDLSAAAVKSKILLCLFVAKTKSVLICAICGYFCAFESLWPILSFARYSSTPKVKKCKKSVQNMLKTCLFLLIFVQNARVFVNFLSIFAHFYPQNHLFSPLLTNIEYVPSIYTPVAYSLDFAAGG